MHEQSVGPGAQALHGYANDMVWRAPIRDSDGRGGAWAHLVVMLEFQSEVDFLMALRVRNYVDNFHTESWRGRRFGAGNRLAPVLPLVLYTGESRWTAAERVIELVTPGGGASARGGWAWVPGTQWRTAPMFAGEGYVLLDAHRVRAEDLRHDNAAALLAGLENSTRETFAGLVAALHRRLRAPELRELREVMVAWATWRARRRLGLKWRARDMAAVMRMEDYDDVEAFYAARLDAWREEFRAEGRVEGQVEGQRESLRRYAEMKFDATAAARLGELLDDVADAEVLDGVLAAVFESDTPEEMLARASSVLERLKMKIV